MDTETLRSRITDVATLQEKVAYYENTFPRLLSALEEAQKENSQLHRWLEYWEELGGLYDAAMSSDDDEKAAPPTPQETH